MKIGILGCDEHILAVAVAAVEGGHTISPAYDVPEDLPPSLAGIDRQPREQWQGLLEDELCMLSLLALMAGANIVRIRYEHLFRPVVLYSLATPPLSQCCGLMSWT